MHFDLFKKKIILFNITIKTVEYESNANILKQISDESQKVVNAHQWCSVENQNGASDLESVQR